jgi:hypothetical protein
MDVKMGDRYFRATDDAKGILVKIKKKENMEAEPITPLRINNFLFLPTNETLCDNNQATHRIQPISDLKKIC